jgi:hypothetical protein
VVKGLTGFNVSQCYGPDVKLRVNWDQSLEYVLKNPNASLQEYGDYFRSIAYEYPVLGAPGTGIMIDDANGICYSLADYVKSLRDHLIRNQIPADWTVARK